MSVAIIGAGGHGLVAQECLELMHPEGIQTVFYDDRYPELQSMDGTPVVGTALDACDAAAPRNVFVAIGQNRTRLELTVRLLRAGKTLPTIVHPSCIVSPNCCMEAGSIVISGSAVNRGARIGRGVILNTLSSAGHDSRIGDFAQLGPGVNLGGGAIIGAGAFLGIGAKVVLNVSVGAWTVAGAGSVVLGDLPTRTFCSGTPARLFLDLPPADLPPVANGFEESAGRAPAADGDGPERADRENGPHAPGQSPPCGNEDSVP